MIGSGIFMSICNMVKFSLPFVFFVKPFEEYTWVETFGIICIYFHDPLEFYQYVTYFLICFHRHWDSAIFEDFPHLLDRRFAIKDSMECLVNVLLESDDISRLPESAVCLADLMMLSHFDESFHISIGLLGVLEPYLSWHLWFAVLPPRRYLHKYRILFTWN